MYAVKIATSILVPQRIQTLHRAYTRHGQGDILKPVLDRFRMLARKQVRSILCGHSCIGAPYMV